MSIIKRENDDIWNTIFLIEDEKNTGCALISVDGKFLRVNRTLSDILEYSYSELLSLSIQDLTHAGDIKAYQNDINHLLLKKGRSCQIRKRYITKTNKIVWAIITVVLIFSDVENVSYLLALIEEINAKEEKEHTEKKVDFLSFIKDNIQSFVITCFTTVSILVTLGVTFYTTVNTVTRLEQESDEQKQLIMKLLERESEEHKVQ